jgi:peptidoglycan/LPS O-acetylase OafA/YrhL
MVGIAVAALGLGWWFDRDHLDLPRLRRVAGAYLVYNFGIGALFLAYASTVERVLPVSWLVAVLHIMAAAAFVVALARLQQAEKRRL